MKSVAAALGLAACQPGSGPTIDRVVPAQGTRGAMVTVHGDGFCGEGRGAGDGTCTTLPPGSVDFGLELPMARALVLSWGETAIAVTVPDAARVGATEVIVTVDGRSSNAGAFEVLP
ncbi:MAG: IPT/TIG domain-containing protein [Deltaproteobacteria bacterium]|nr:IPT/TIG domain-containing protein [Kofleriaceae bacterium]